MGNCEIFNETLNRCNISVLPYNIYRLSEELKRSSEKSDDQSALVFGKSRDLDQKPRGLGI
jgi:hypothetical protein